MLLGAIAVALAVETLLALTEPESTFFTAIDVGVLLLIGLFSGRPTIAAAALVVAASVAFILGSAGSYVLALAVATGLVVATCAPWLVLLYCLAVATWSFVAALSRQELTEVGALVTVVIALVSGLIGWHFRRSLAREAALASRVDRLIVASASAVQDERDRIADELHNIIAHDITTVVMHVRALEMSTDPTSRETSMRAISQGATQALTDIRRMLRVVQGTNEPSEAIYREHDDLAETLRSLAADIESLGIPVDLVLPASVGALSSSIASTLAHIAHEATTNLLRHARGAGRVRIALDVTDAWVTLTVWNASPAVPESDPRPSSRYGLRRMQDRVAMLGGAFSAGPADGGWQVEARLPSR